MRPFFSRALYFCAKVRFWGADRIAVSMTRISAKFETHSLTRAGRLPTWTESPLPRYREARLVNRPSKSGSIRHTAARSSILTRSFRQGWEDTCKLSPNCDHPFGVAAPVGLDDFQSRLRSARGVAADVVRPRGGRERRTILVERLRGKNGGPDEANSTAPEADGAASIRKPWYCEINPNREGRFSSL